MALTSALFLFAFLPPLLVVYHVATRLAHVYAEVIKTVVLLLASLVFYVFAGTAVAGLLCVWILYNYGAALLIQKKHSKLMLAALIIVDVGVLFFYKYLGFLGSVIEGATGLSFPSTTLVAPLGISFLTFSALSYLIDVYRGVVAADKNLLRVALYLAFFPKVIQGPLVRYAAFFSKQNTNAPLSASAPVQATAPASMPKSGSRSSLSAHSSPPPSVHVTLDDAFYGARRFIFGLAKKLLIADFLAVRVDEIFAMQATTGVTTPTAWLGIILFALQLYFDFSGYTDMAIGLARLFGYRLPENFNFPYLAHSIGDFWRRWHITLCDWMRDYLYIPLGGSRRGNVYVNLIIVFLVSGFWHGASWHFIAWGAWYALFICLEHALHALWRTKAPPPKAVGIIVTQLIVLGGWVFFRAEGMTQALTYLGTLVGITATDAQFYGLAYLLDARTVCVALIACVLSTPVAKILGEKFAGKIPFEVARSCGILLLCVLCFIALVSSTYSPFLYEQF
jgi:alginate O-acetyltransferase complex protein AlgI